MSNRVFALTILVAVAATPALAQTSSAGQAPSTPSGGRPMRGPGPMGGGMGMMRMADANGDGVVTRAEYVAAVDARFARMDANHDGMLSPDEMPMRGGPRGGMIGGAGGRDVPPAPPANGSSPDATGTPPAPATTGTRPPVTRDDYRAGAMRRFDRLDANGDGKVDEAEMAAAAPPPRGGE